MLVVVGMNPEETFAIKIALPQSCRLGTGT